MKLARVDRVSGEVGSRQQGRLGRVHWPPVLQHGAREPRAALTGEEEIDERHVGPPGLDDLQILEDGHIVPRAEERRARLQAGKNVLAAASGGPIVTEIDGES
jgi:hypothetical protein